VALQQKRTFRTTFCSASLSWRVRSSWTPWIRLWNRCIFSNCSPNVDNKKTT